MKLSLIKFANSIKVGNEEKLFCESQYFDLDLDGHIVTVTNKRTGAAVKTSLYNTVWWKDDEQTTSAHSMPSGNKAKSFKAVGS